MKLRLKFFYLKLPIKKRVFSVLLLVVFATLSCSQEEESTAIIEIRNGTKFKVDIYYKSRMGQEFEINIPRYSNHSKSESAFGGIYTNLDNLMIMFGDADTVQVLFSNKKATLHTLSSTANRNILNIENYSMEVKRDKPFTISTYTYTITDEDYENAVSVEE